MLRLRTRILLEHALCLALLGAGVLIALHPVVLWGRVPIHAEGLLALTPWSEAAVAFEGSAETPLPTPAARFYPWFAFLNDAARRGDSLLWNPYEGFGSPFFAAWRTRCLSPFSLPFYFLPLHAAFRLSIIAKIAAAGLCAFYVARRLGFALPMALFVGLSFELCGHLLVWCNWPIADAVVWLPLVFLFTERVAMGQPRVWPIGALTFALMLLGGDPEAVIGALVFMAVYLIALYLLARGQGFHLVSSGIAVFGAAIAGALLVAAQIIPYIEFRSEGYVPAGPGSSFLAWSDLLALFLPKLLTGAEQASVGPAASSDPHAFRLLYVGAVQILLVPLWAAVRPFTMSRHRHRIESLLVAAGVLTAMAFLLHRFDGVPVLGRLGPQHLLAGNSLAFALIAAAAAEEWLDLDASRCMSAIKRLAVTVPVFLVVPIALLLVAPHGQPKTLLILRLGEFFLFAAGLATLAAFTLIRPSQRILGYGMAVLAAVDLLLVFGPSVPRTRPEALFPETSFIASLREAGGRIGGSVALARWPLAGNLIPQVHAAAGVRLRRQAAFMAQAANDPLLLRRAGCPTLVLAKEDLRGAYASVRPVLKLESVFDSGAGRFEDSQAKSRAWMAYDGRAAEPFVADDLASGNPPMITGIAPPANGSGAEARCEVLPPSTHVQVDVRIADTGPGVLVLTDAVFPGWQAEVDGEPASIGVVDGVFRGVALDQGSHEVRFSYAPASLQIGMIVSAVTALMLIGALTPIVVGRIRRRRERWT